ncbi:zinc-binding dehydrogenase [Streptomyces tubercidicus]|uniref:zinc-binding dehydrogenase n=1 Tax=Streptomyces tubercidicus TaxID=47759 RepID=UPI00280B4D0A|nr:zinc-binding dehydrogenase [Streptomyces tubercidicus]
MLELTDGQGVDAAIEALGAPQTWEAAFRVTKPGGRISNVGYHGEAREPLQIPLEPFGYGTSRRFPVPVPVAVAVDSAVRRGRFPSDAMP